MTVSPAERIVVLGAGIGGLACALALARRGRDVEVFERAPRLGDAGAGVQISPNGARVLDVLGLHDAVVSRAVRSRAVVLRDGVRDRDVVRIPLGARRFLMIRRADLVACLAQALTAAGGRLRFGRQAVGVSAGSSPRLDFADGTFTEADMIVGADGLHSVLRPALGNPSRPFFTGQVAWRALVQGAAPPEARVEMGPGRHVVHYPLGRDLINVVAVEERAAWAGEGWNVAGDPAALRRAFAGMAAPVRALLGRAERVHLWGLFRHPVAEVWHDGSRVLLGDAAHPTLPFLAQGANLALEDAWCLAAALGATDRVAALDRYQAERVPRVARAIAAADANARNYHLSGGRRLAAHAALRMVGALAPGRLMARLDWLYGHDVTANG